MHRVVNSQFLISLVPPPLRRGEGGGLKLNINPSLSLPSKGRELSD